jgi:hypothetical protein
LQKCEAGEAAIGGFPSPPGLFQFCCRGINQRAFAI